MMLMMLTPGLACASAVCNAQSRAASMQAADNPPCHHMGHKAGQSGDEQNQQNKSEKQHVMLLGDCAGIDLQTASHGPDISEPDAAAGKILPFDGLVFLPASDFPPLAVNAIRGPPPQGQILTSLQSSIILTTQRLRI